jgi:hypothetical protein
MVYFGLRRQNPLSREGLMAKVVKFSVVDASGAGLSNQKILAGDVEITTGATGMAQALLEDGNTVITVNGTKAYEGPVANLQSTEVFGSGGERKR